MGPEHGDPQSREAAGSPEQGKQEQGWERPTQTPHPLPGRKAHHPAASAPDGPWLSFDAAHHLELLQIPEPDGPAKAVRLCWEAGIPVLASMQAHGPGVLFLCKRLSPGW